VNPKEYSTIFYAGGHGAMWDFADNKELANIASKIYENGGIVAEYVMVRQVWSISNLITENIW
jgi:putative intracellular protease/amidase